jgi:hypothetical protein
VFVVVFAALYTVEFQKRGLPHVHMLVWLDRRGGRVKGHRDEVPREASAQLIDSIISTELPDVVCDPKSFSDDTSVDQSGFPVYRRRDDGRTVMKDGHCLDNKWVVPHNVVLLKRYQAHINVDWCNKTNLVKYMFKYITKGPDRANIMLRPLGVPQEGQEGEEGVDEVAEY